MDRPLVERFWDNQLDSDSEGAPAAAPMPMTSLAENVPPTMPAATSGPPTCISYQHPGSNPPTGWLSLGCWEEMQFAEGEVAAGSGGGASSSSGGMGIGSGTSASAVSALSVVVVEDDPTDDELIAIGPSAPSSASPVQFWILRIGPRMVEADDCVRENCDRIRWDLPPPGANIADHAIGIINDTLRRGYVKAFYIGLTARLRQRWEGEDNPLPGRKPMIGHNVAWQHMVIVGCSDHADKIGQAEISVVAQFRRFDRGRLPSQPKWP